MSLPAVSVRRPVAVAMLFLAVIFLGLISFFRIPIDLLPDISYPRLVVYTRYSDVGPAEVERFVTERTGPKYIGCLKSGLLLTTTLRM